MMTLWKRGDTETSKREHYIALSEELALENAEDLSSERPGNQ
jgi:hypothetical protein